MVTRARRCFGITPRATPMPGGFVVNIEGMRCVLQRVRAGSILIVAVVAASCGERSPLGPLAPGHARLSLAPRFATVAGAPAVPLSRIDGSLTRSGGDPIRATANFVDGSASLTFDAPVFGESTEYVLQLVGFDVAGTQAYSGQHTYIIKPGVNDNLDPPLLEYSAPDARATALHLTAGATTLDPGATTKITATGTDANNAAISPIRIGWTSRNTSIATVDDAGNIVASQLTGQTYIVARTPANLADSLLIKTRGAVAQVIATPASISLLRGGTSTITAEVRDPSGTLIADRAPTFTSSDDRIATVTAAGSITGIAVGSATITATAGDKTSTAAVTVASSVAGIQLDASTVTLANIGDGQQLSATITAKAGGSVVGLTPTFTTSDNSVAVVTADGRVSAAGYGVATITATIETFTATATVSVVGPLVISPATPTIFSRATQQLTVTAGGKGPFTWTVNGVTGGNATLGQISASGLYTAPAQIPIPASFDICAVQASPATQGCTRVTIASPVAGIQLAPPTVTLPEIGGNAQLTATVIAKPGASVAGLTPTFTTSDATVATVAADGRVTATGYGIATITATIESFTAATSVSVVGPLVNAPAAPTIFSNSTQQFQVTAGGKGPFAWTVNGVAGGNETVGQISAAGVYTPASSTASGATSFEICAVQTTPATQGCTKVSVTSPVAGIQLAPPTVTLANIGDGQQLTATIIAKPDGSVVGFTPAFTTSDPNVATVSSAGRVTAVNWGTATITARIETFTATSTISVVAPLTLSPKTADKLPNGTQQFQVLAGGSGPFTWTVNGVMGGSAVFGTITASGFYVAPATVPNPSTFDVCAVQLLPATQGCATVTIHAVPPAGTDVVVLNDVNVFDATGMADANNRLFVNNLVSYTGPGPRATQTGVELYLGHGSLFPPSVALLNAAMPGFTIATVTETAITSIPATFKVLFLWAPTVAFSNAEINVMKQFSAEGGRIVFVGEHSGVYATGIPIENNFLSNMGAQMTNAGGAFDCANPDYPILPASRLTTTHQVMTGLTQLTVACASEVVPGPNDFVLFRSVDGTRVLGGVAKIDVTPLQLSNFRKLHATVVRAATAPTLDAAGRPLKKQTP
jgi:uncharacterized protein YjdB